MSAREAKQVLIVRKDLSMRKGKIAAQCSHASMKVLLDRMAVKPWPDANAVERVLVVPANSAFEAWLSGSFTKITVSVDSDVALQEIYAQAVAAALPCSLITDEGRTEFNGVPTRTAVAIGPAWADEIDPITGKLPLL